MEASEAMKCFNDASRPHDEPLIVLEQQQRCQSTVLSIVPGCRGTFFGHRRCERALGVSRYANTNHSYGTLHFKCFVASFTQQWGTTL